MIDSCMTLDDVFLCSLQTGIKAVIPRGVPDIVGHVAVSLRLEEKLTEGSPSQ